VTGDGWLALAGAIVLAGWGPVRPDRIIELAAAGRLAAPSAGRRAAVVRKLPPVALGAVLGCAVVAVTVTAGGALGLAVAAVSGAGGSLGRAALRRRRVLRERGELAVALGALIAELEVGGRPAEALAAAAAAGPVHRPVFRRAADGAAAGDEVAPLLESNPPTRSLGCAWRLGEQTGAPLVAVITRVADDLAADAAHERTVAIALAGPQASAAVLAGLPLLGLALGAAMGAHPAHFLLQTRAGPVVACVGVLLDVLGLAWIQGLLRRVRRS
jgi:tight adherence protein B